MLKKKAYNLTKRKDSQIFVGRSCFMQGKIHMKGHKQKKRMEFTFKAQLQSLEHDCL